MMITLEQAVDKASDLLDQLVVHMKQFSEEKKRVDIFERELFARLLEIGRELLAGYLSLAGDGDVGETCWCDGKELRRLEDTQDRNYRSIFGVLEFTRRVYAIREGQKTYSPVDKQLGMPEGEQSYALEDWLQRFCVQNAFTPAVDSLNDLLGTNTSKRSAERINQELAKSVEPFRKSRYDTLPEAEEEILVATGDGKGVPMRHTLEERMGLPEPAWRRCQRKKQEAKSDKRATKRLTRGQVSSQKQMAYVGAVYSIAKWERTPEQILDDLLRNKHQNDRPEPKNKRVQAHMTHYREEERLDGQPALFAELAAEINKRDPGQQKPLVCIMDGQLSLWRLQAEMFPRATCIVDIFHVTEKLWAIAYCFHKQGSRAAEDLVTHYLKMLLEGKISHIIGTLQRKQNSLSKPKSESLGKLLTYLRNNKQYMQYDVYLQKGYPIGSGVIEGACRHLVCDRLEGTGMRWEIQGAQAMLDTRSAFINKEWDELIEYRIQNEQERLYGQAA